jgi:hypothetical protein
MEYNFVAPRKSLKSARGNAIKLSLLGQKRYDSGKGLEKRLRWKIDC